MKRFLLAAALLCSGCGMRHVQVRPGELVVDRACMESVELTETTECRMRLDETTLHCTGLKLVKRLKCERIEVTPKKKEEKSQ